MTRVKTATAPSVARRLAALERLGFTRIDHPSVTTEVIPLGRNAVKVTGARPAMGTLVTIATVSRSQERGAEAIGRSFEEMDRLIGVFSRFEPSSATTELNTAGLLDHAPPEFSRVLAEARRYYGVTAGAFDITVAPLVELYRERLTGPTASEPSATEVRDALALVGTPKMRQSRRRVRFDQAGMGVTLDGVAKGYIVDAMAAVLSRHGIRNYLINAGGDIRAKGRNEKHQPWTVAVQDPAKRGPFPDQIQLTDAAVATSGGYESHFDSDGTHHHIVSARTGRSPTRSASVSVVAPNAMAADVLATAVFVMEPRRGLAFIHSLSGPACLIITEDGSHLTSRTWRSGRHHDATSS